MFIFEGKMRHLRIFIIIIVIAFIGGVFGIKTYQRNKIDKDHAATAKAVKTSEKAPVKESLPENSKTLLPQKDLSTDLEALKSALGEFDIPPDLKKQILDSASRNEIKTQWTENKVSKEELIEIGLSPEQISSLSVDKNTQNIISGFQVSDKTFNQALNAALPQEGLDDAQTRELKSKALSDLGFSAIADFNYEQAETAFKAVIEHYEDTESAPIVYLEYSRLLLEQERIDQAKDTIDNALYAYADNLEYVEIAESLRQVIQEHE